MFGRLAAEAIEERFLQIMENATKSILTEADEIIHGDRHESYGPYERECERIALGWGLILGVPVEADKVPLMMIWLKVSRECNSHKRDNLVDIAGYAALLQEMYEQDTPQA